MIQQSKCNPLWIDSWLDIKFSEYLSNRYSHQLDIMMIELLNWVDLPVTHQSRDAILDIAMNGLSENRFLALHKAIFNGPLEFWWVYRQIVMMAGNKNFVDAWKIQDEMNTLFQIEYNTPFKVFYWMIEVLGRIHPFIDMNRRTIFLAADAQLLFLKMSPICWWKNRNIWENARILSNGIDSKKRLHLIMESCMEN